MKRKNDFDYIVIGSGPAGSTAALFLAKAKKRVALIEEHFFGGTNLNTRDIPYYTALRSANLYHKVLSAPEFTNQDISISLPNLLSHQLKAIIKAGGNDKKPYEEAGVVCLHGPANLLNKTTVAVGDQQFTTNSFILATGSRLKTSEISGVDSVSYLTPESAIKVRRLPKVAIVIGAGSSGCEIAEFYAKLGTKVILLEMADRILPHEDPEVGQAITDYFTRELGMIVLPNCKVVALEQQQGTKRIIFHNGNSEKYVQTDCVILATGSQPYLEYGLENAGIKYKNSGITTDRLFQTSTKNIYAIGDSLGGESSTARAEYQGMLLAYNLIHKAKNTPSYNGFVRTTKTCPEIATVGLTEDDLIKRDRKYKKAVIKLQDTIIGKITDDKYSFVKLICDKKTDRVLGCTIVSPNAELIAEEMSFAIRHHIPAIEIASTPHPTNNYNYMIKLAAKELAAKKK